MQRAGRRVPYLFSASAADSVGFRACGLTVLSSTVSSIDTGDWEVPRTGRQDVCPTAQNRYRVRRGDGAIELPAAAYFFTNKAREAV